MDARHLLKGVPVQFVPWRALMTPQNTEDLQKSLFPGAPHTDVHMLRVEQDGLGHRSGGRSPEDADRPRTTPFHRLGKHLTSKVV